MCEICQAGDSSLSTRRGGALAVWSMLWGVIALSARLHFTPLSHNWGKGPQGLFSPNSPSLCFAFTDPHSLSNNVPIDPRPRDGQPRCEVQGEVDQKIFLSYDCGTAKIKYMSPLGEEVKNMSAWETQTVTLRDTGEGGVPCLANFTHPGCVPLSTRSVPSIITFAETCQAAMQEKSR